ncbi:hypothetical protein DERF_001543 [Dermatophagoides farinae]|uniref:Uncharacterized protein n=1 Tax=Dermatophagoides farinae TaxID=6954 RepID=A0A922IDX8_DERFA|nr:hypothetical protein HUG17_4674 [Dermatophagoides farinae]KAH9527534.1 hypothetical protein DERF_001543 [Dermatophagoides farinae]
MTLLRDHILPLTIVIFIFFIISISCFTINQGICAGTGEVCGGVRGVTCCNTDLFCDHSLGTGGFCNLVSHANLPSSLG